MTPPAELTDILPLDWTPTTDFGSQWTATDGPLAYFAAQPPMRRGWTLGVSWHEELCPEYTAIGVTVTDALEQLIRLVVEFRGRNGQLDRLAVLRLAMGVRP